MKTRISLVFAALAIVMVALSPISMAANVRYPDPETALEDGFYVDWYHDPSANNDVNTSDNIIWVVYYLHSDDETQGVNPRLNWDSAGSSVGSKEPSDVTLYYGDSIGLVAQTTVYDGSTTYTLYDTVTYHRVDYPWNNAIAQSSNFQFH